MDLRINLLPPAIIEARKWERGYRYVYFVSFVVLALSLLAGLWLWVSVQAKTDTLQGLKQQSSEYSAQAAAFAVFEKRQEELAAHQAIVTKALSGRINAGRLADEVSLVLPEETWLGTLSIGESSGLVMTGYTPLTSSQSTRAGYKSVAATMVRLSSLTDVTDVWLNTAISTEFSSWRVDADKTPPTTSQPVVSFAIAGKVNGTVEEPSIANPGPE